MKPPDVQTVVMESLQSLNVPVTAIRLDDGTPQFIRVVNTGGPGRSDRIVHTTQLTISSYAKTPGLAYALATSVEELLHGLPTLSDSPVAAVQFATAPHDSPDPDTTMSRYVATYQLTVICR